MQRELTTFPLPQHVRFKLCNNGFTTVEDLQNIGPVELATETQLTQEEAVEVLELVFPENIASTSNQIKALGVSALDILLEEKSKPPIPTFCHALDQILGGGIPLKKVTELCGAPGTGKTQMCLQLCTNVQIPTVSGGLQGQAVFIDTEGSFIIDRLVQIADSTVDTCQKIMKAANPSATFTDFNTKTILEGVYYFHCKGYTELIARINLMSEFLKTHSKVSLLIIDSISFHFRYGFDESYALRTRLLNGLSQSLVRTANEFGIAVLLTNQMTTRIEGDEGSLVPSLGESWGHACTIRIILSWNDGKKQAFLFKSPWKEEATAPYQITASGIRDVLSLEKEDKPSTCQGWPPYKKAKTSI